MFNPTREQVRDFFFASWQKFNDKLPLTPLEGMAVDIMVDHPEYQQILSQRDQYVDRDYAPEHGDINPFLHMSMHLSIREQISIDQPPGVMAQHQRLCRSLGGAMEAEHAMMDCLAEMIWQAQRAGTAPDASIYLACLVAK